MRRKKICLHELPYSEIVKSGTINSPQAYGRAGRAWNKGWWKYYDKTYCLLFYFFQTYLFMLFIILGLVSLSTQINDWERLTSLLSTFFRPFDPLSFYTQIFVFFTLVIIFAMCANFCLKVAVFAGQLTPAGWVGGGVGVRLAPPRPLSHWRGRAGGGPGRASPPPAHASPWGAPCATPVHPTMVPMGVGGGFSSFLGHFVGLDREFAAKRKTWQSCNFFC